MQINHVRKGIKNQKYTQQLLQFMQWDGQKEAELTNWVQPLTDIESLTRKDMRWQQDARLAQLPWMRAGIVKTVRTINESIPFRRG